MKPDAKLLTSYWFEDETGETWGYGVTAYSEDDAWLLLEQAGMEINRASLKVKEGIKVADLDQNHVVPNMGVIVRRGVWFPNMNASR